MSDTPAPTPAPERRTISDPGVYRAAEMPADDYHADPCPFPSMAASDAQTIMERSPLHCWYGSRRLNPDIEPFEASREMDEGSALHSLIADGGARIAVVQFDDYRKNDARAQRAMARAEGLIPVLKGRLPLIEAVASSARKLILQHGPLREAMSSKGWAEASMFWQEDNGLWCRARPDFLPTDPAAPLIDWKFTTRDAAPRTYERAVQERYALRAAHYLRGAQRLRRTRPEGYWLVVVEMEAPHGVMVHEPDEGLLTAAGKVWTAARDLFSECLSQGEEREHWPGYPAVVNAVAATPWQLSQWEVAGIEMAERRKGLTVAGMHRAEAAIGGPVA